MRQTATDTGTVAAVTAICVWVSSQTVIFWLQVLSLAVPTAYTIWKWLKDAKKGRRK